MRFRSAVLLMLLLLPNSKKIFVTFTTPPVIDDLPVTKVVDVLSNFEHNIRLRQISIGAEIHSKQTHKTMSTKCYPAIRRHVALLFVVQRKTCMFTGTFMLQKYI